VQEVLNFLYSSKCFFVFFVVKEGGEVVISYSDEAVKELKNKLLNRKDKAGEFLEKFIPYNKY